jgi:hypothetical protein
MPKQTNFSSLPQDQQLELARMVQQGLPLPAIRERLGEAGKKLTQASLVRWARKWLKDRQRAELRRLIANLAVRIEREARGEEVQGASVDLANLQLFNVLAEFDPESLTKALKGDIDSYARIVRALVSLSDNSLKRAGFAKLKAELEAAIQKSKAGGVPRETFETTADQMNLL